MAKYVDVEILEALSAQMEIAAHEAHAAYRETTDEFLLGQYGGYQGASLLVQTVIQEHAITGRLKWND